MALSFILLIIIVLYYMYKTVNDDNWPGGTV